MSIVKVTVIAGRDLPAMDSTGKSDPYVILDLANSRKKTKIQKQTLTPTWNETFSFQLKTVLLPSLLVEVWDWDRAARDDFMGQVVIDLNKVESDVDVWYKLGVRGAAAGGAAGGTAKGELSLRIEKSANEKKLIPAEVMSSMKSRIKACLDSHSTELDISGCMLPILPKLVTEQLTYLNKLDLSFNKLASLPELSPLTALTDLDLNGNQLTELGAGSSGPTISSLTSLRSLSLNGNALSSVPPAIGKLTGLERLSIANNGLTEIPKEIGRLWNLEELVLMGNSLTTLPASMGALKNLNLLDLSCCLISSLPPEICLATRLIEINLGNNKLTELPAAVGRLTRLVTLNLQDNGLTDLPVQIGHCAGLGTLGYGINIARNPIKDDAMLAKYAVGPDHLLDYLMKRMAMLGTPPIPVVHMPVDLGEGPPPPWAKPVAAPAPTAGTPAAAAAAAPTPASSVGLSQKLIALKTWGINTTKDELRMKITQFRADTRSAATVNSLLDVDYRIKGLNVELDKLKQLAPFEVSMPRELPMGTPVIEQLRGLTMAALNTLDNALRAVQLWLTNPAMSDINAVVKVVQSLTNIKAQFSK